jgi:hypothetical protein
VGTRYASDDAIGYILNNEISDEQREGLKSMHQRIGIK